MPTRGSSDRLQRRRSGCGVTRNECRSGPSSEPEARRSAKAVVTRPRSEKKSTCKCKKHSMLAFNRTDLERLFPSTTWQRAEIAARAERRRRDQRRARRPLDHRPGARRAAHALPDPRQHRERPRRPDPAVQHLHLPGLQRVRARGGDAAGGARRDRGAGRRRGQRRDRSASSRPGSPRSTRARARRPTAMPATAPTACSTCSSRRSGCGATRPRSSRSAVSTFRARRLRGGLYGREHPLAMSNLVGRGSGELRRRRGPGDRPAARRRPTRRPSGWARSATATRCAGCWRPAAATGATARAAR